MISNSKEGIITNSYDFYLFIGNTFVKLVDFFIILLIFLLVALL